MIKNTVVNSSEKGNRKRLITKFALWNVLLGTLSIAFWLLATHVPFLADMPCFIHDVIHLYCPFCGGTRALNALLSFDFQKAFQYYPLLYCLIGCAAFYEGRAVYSIIKGHSSLLKLQKWEPWIWLTVLLLFALIRNILLVIFKLDGIGDLLPYWV